MDYPELSTSSTSCARFLYTTSDFVHILSINSEETLFLLGELSTILCTITMIEEYCCTTGNNASKDLLVTGFFLINGDKV